MGRAKLEKDKKARDSLYRAITNGAENLSSIYLWEATKKLDIKYASDDAGKQIMDILDVKEQEDERYEKALYTARRYDAVHSDKL